MPKKKIEKVHLTVNVSPQVNEWLDNMALKLGMSKSQLVSNLIEMGMDDTEMIESVGLLGAARYIRKLREKSSKSKGRLDIEAGE